MRRDVAAILNCLFCDSYLLLILCALDLSSYAGREGKQALDDRLLALARRYAGRDSTRFTSVACPRCCEAASGKSWQEFVASGDAAVLTPARFVSFSEPDPADAMGGLPPLYMDHAEEGRPPAFRLQFGIGPPALELEKRGRDGLVVYGPSLRQYGIESAGPARDAPRPRPAVVRQRAELVWRAVAGAGEGAGAVLGGLEAARPALGRWAEVEARLDLAALALDPGDLAGLALHPT